MNADVEWGLFPHQSLSCHMPHRVVNTMGTSICWACWEDPGQKKKPDHLPKMDQFRSESKSFLNSCFIAREAG